MANSIQDRGVIDMKIVVINLMNRLLSGAIIKYIQEREEMMPIRVNHDQTLKEPCDTTLAHKADILLMETTLVHPFTLEERLKTAHQVKERLPHCKVVLLCDENAHPSLAEKVKKAKKEGSIDSFFYTSVSGEYISAMLDAL